MIPRLFTLYSWMSVEVLQQMVITKRTFCVVPRLNIFFKGSEIAAVQRSQLGAFCQHGQGSHRTLAGNASQQIGPGLSHIQSA